MLDLVEAMDDLHDSYRYRSPRVRRRFDLGSVAVHTHEDEVQLSLYCRIQF